MEYISLKEAANEFSPPKCYRTVLRYVSEGLLRNGKRVKLKSRWNGGERVTSIEWVEEFLDRLDQSK